MSAQGPGKGEPSHIDRIERVPPHSLEAEQAVLGSILLSDVAYAFVAGILQPEAFYRDAHQIVYRAIQTVARMGEVDAITVGERLRQDGDIERAGGLSYLHTLVSVVPTAGNAQHYAGIVLSNYHKRRIIDIGTEIVRSGYESSDDAIELAKRAENSLFELQDSGYAQTSHEMDELAAKAMKEIDDVFDGKVSEIGIPTGFPDLDYMLGGLQPANLIILGARPSMGKTALALNIAQNVAHAGKRVLVFSIEMGQADLVRRMVSSAAKVDQKVMRRGPMSHAEWERLQDATSRMAELPMTIDEANGLTVAEVYAKAKRVIKRKGKLDLIVIDYLQMMAGTERYENKNVEISNISRGLKILSKQLNVPMLVLAQLSREGSKEGKKPQLTSLRDSGAIEQDADVVMFIHRDSYYEDAPSDEADKAEIIVAKHRNGPTGVVELVFLRKYARFGSASRE